MCRASRAPDLAARHRSRRAEGALSAASERLRRLPRRRQRARPAPRPPAEGLRHRHVGASLPGQEAVPELLDHRPALPPGARAVRHQDDRGGDVPPAGLSARSSPPREPTAADAAPSGAPTDRRRSDARDRLVHRDNTFGTPEEDAFRRDFTINALFYDIGTFSIIDYAGGLEDLRDGVVRWIGDPTSGSRRIRCACCARSPWPRGSTSASIRRSTTRSHAHRAEIARSAPARLIEEFYKLLRSGAAENGVPHAGRARLLEPIAPELQRKAPTRRCGSRWPRSTPIAHDSRRVPDTLTNADPARIAAGAARLQHERSITRVDAVRRAGPRRLRRAKEPRLLARHAAAGATRHRAAAPDPVAAAAAASTRTCRRAPARADAPRTVPRSADLARDPRPGARRCVEHWRGFIEALRRTTSSEQPSRRQKTGVARRRRRRRAATPASDGASGS